MTSAAPTPAPLAADQMVLSPDQLPGAGWKPDDDGDPESTQRQPASQPECSNQSWTLRTEEMTDQAGAGWYFDQAAEVEAITSQAFVYRNEQAAATALAAYRDVVEQCVSWQMGAGTAGYTFQEGQEPFDAAVGDESVALVQTTAMVRYPDVPASSSYWVSARVGASIVQVTYWAQISDNSLDVYADVILGIYRHEVGTAFDIAGWNRMTEGPDAGRIAFTGKPLPEWEHLIGTPNPGTPWTAGMARPVQYLDTHTLNAGFDAGEEDREQSIDLRGYTLTVHSDGNATVAGPFGKFPIRNAAGVGYVGCL